MRFISIDNAKEGMIVGRPLRGRNGEILLTAGMTLRSSFIESVKRLRYSGLYISDAFSEGIEANDVVTEELRSSAALAIKQLESGMLSGTSRGVGNQLKLVSDFIEEIIDSVLASKDTVFNMVDLKIYDLYTYQHSVNVCVLSELIGSALKLDRAQLYNLGITSILHDIGKFFIDKNLLDKPGKLTPEEFAVVKKHSEMGCDYLRANFNYSAAVHVGILQHHERYNGMGYPHGRSGSDIHLFARIIAIADVYDAITSLRPYHAPILPSEAYEYILGNAGQHFDPEITAVFLRKVAPFPEGVEVELSDGRRGVVFKNYADCMTRPRVKIIPPSGDDEIFADLRDDPALRSVTIVKIV